MPGRTYYVYIVASHTRRLYTGVTGDLLRRMWEHRSGVVGGYTARYGMKYLVHYEATDNASAAVAREKQIKSWTRAKRIALIEAANAGWRDLAEPWFAGAYTPRHPGQ